MRPAIAIVADDLTGAADTGVAFVGCELSAVVSWPGRDLADVWRSLAPDVLAVDARSRAVDLENARTITSQVVSLCREAGATTLYKKIDSMLRGHVAGEV